jgi:hypothetical protein
MEAEPASGYHFFRRLLAGAAAMSGRDIDVTRKYKGWLQAAGFVDVVEKVLLLP